MTVWPDDDVILYDGVCVFCSRWVRFVATRDVERKFRFTAIQSPYGTRLAQVYLKSFGAHVRSAVLMGFAPLDYKVPLFHAAAAQRVLDLVLEEAGEDKECALASDEPGAPTPVFSPVVFQRADDHDERART